MFTSWSYLFIAIISEVLGTTCMKLSNGFTKIGPSILMFICYAASLGALTIAVKKIEISMAYAIWSGLGTVLIAIIGIYLFKEGINLLKIVSIFLVIAGVVGLNLSTKH